MEKALRGILTLWALGAAWACCAEKQPFERYQSIIDRQMFGVPPKGFDPTVSPDQVRPSKSGGGEQELTEEQAKLQGSVQFTVINKTPEGAVEVGFTDSSDPKKPRQYYPMREGDERDGWEVREIDFDAGSLTLAKDDVEITLTLGEGSDGKGGGKGGNAAGVRNSRSGMLGGASNLRERRRRREEAAQAERAAADARAKAAAEKAAEAEARAEEEKARAAADRELQKKQLADVAAQLKAMQELKRKEQERAEKAEGENDANDAE